MCSSQQKDWDDLAIRNCDGLEVMLLWSKSAERVRVTVQDHRLGGFLDLDVPAGDALSAFYHPFPYAAGHDLVLDGVLPSSPDLQPHN